MARAGVTTLNAVNASTEGVAIPSGRRQWLSWSFQPNGTVTGGVSLQLKVRLTESGDWYDIGAARTNVAGRFIIGNIPMPIFEARVDQTGNVTGGGTISATIMYG